MRIGVVGTGYVGLVTGVCFADLGVEVVCVDTDARKVEQLRAGQIPIYEPGLAELLSRCQRLGRISFTTSLPEVLDSVDIVFIAVGTPPVADGSADLRYVLQVAQTIGEHIEGYKLVVVKSTVPVGTCHRVKESIAQEVAKRKKEVEFDVASNPEFLKEGDAIADFMRPDRVVVGVDSERAHELLTELYRPMLLNNFRVLFMDIPSAELTKYAANAMLATRISFMNEMANLCEKVGADITSIRQGIGADDRIGRRFLYAGCGYGGSCFPKDVKALVRTCCDNGVPSLLLEAVEEVNANQKEVLFHKFARHYKGQVKGKRAAIWGLAFKPQTDDMREAPSLVLISQLLEAVCHVAVFDPVALEQARRILGDSVTYAETMYEALKDADVLFHVTEWKDFRFPDWERVKSLMRVPLLIDGRNVFSHLEKEGIIYLTIGR